MECGSVTEDVALVVSEMLIELRGYDCIACDGNVPVSRKPRYACRVDLLRPAGHAVMGKCLLDMIAAVNCVQDNGDMQAWVGES